jgi:hypothetical protein
LFITSGEVAPGVGDCGRERDFLFKGSGRSEGPIGIAGKIPSPSSAVDFGNGDGKSLISHAEITYLAVRIKKKLIFSSDLHSHSEYLVSLGLDYCSPFHTFVVLTESFLFEIFVHCFKLSGPRRSGLSRNSVIANKSSTFSSFQGLLVYTAYEKTGN